MNKEKSKSGDLAQLAPIKKRSKRKLLKKSKSSPATLATVNELITRTISSTSLGTGTSIVPETIYEPEHRIISKLNSHKDEFQFPDDDLSSLGSAKGKSKASGRYDRHHLDNISINSPTSYRSYSSNLSLDTDYSHQSKLTNREMIRDISFRAEKGLAPPDYVPSFEELAPVHLSWNKKIPRKHRKSKSLSSRVDNNSDDESSVSTAHPPINIIPCMHPIELILACADNRTRKRERVIKLKQKKCEEKVEQINQAIEKKFTRAEKYAAALELKQRQIAWIKIMAVNLYMKAMKYCYDESHKHHGRFQQITKAAIVLQRSLKEFMRRKLIGVKHFSFMQKLKSSRMRFIMHVRILKKQMMAKRIIRFLTDFKNNHQIPRVVKKYMAGVRKIQRIMRDFLTCKGAKIEVLGKVWERMEVRYIKKKLEERRAQKRGLSEKISKFNAQAAKEENNELNVHSSVKKDAGEYNSRAKNEIKNQTKYWNKIDAMMENKIVALKSNGMLAEENEEEAIQKCMLPTYVRNCILRNMLERLRKEFYTSQKMQLKKEMDANSVFKENHALDLLRGHTNDLNRIINDKFNKKLVKLEYKPFLLFMSISNKAVYDKVREAHKVNETFKIRIEQAKKASVALTVTPSNPASKVAQVVASREAEAARIKLSKLIAL